MAAEVKITTRLDSAGFKKGMKGMSTSVNGFEKMLGGLKGKLMGLAAVAAFGKITKRAVDAAASVEDLVTQFNVLFRSTDRAVKRVEDLKEFSAVTPFQLEDIANASRTLEVFSEGILGDVKSLKLFGDVAAGVGQKDLKDMSFWVGRLFAALQSGRPIMDTINALSRLGVLGPNITKTLLDMNAAGADADDIWNTFTDSLKRFENGMADMSKTTSGKTSTMKDNWKLAFAEMGSFFEPLTKKAIDASTKIAQAFGNMFKTLTKARDPFEAAENAFRVGVADEGIEKAKAATAAQFRRKREEEARKKREAAQFKEFQKLDSKAKTQREKTIKDNIAANKKEFDMTVAAAKKIGEIKKSTQASSVAADRLAGIGGQLGGAVSPELKVERQQLQITKEIKKVLQDLPPKIAGQLVTLGALE